MSAIQIFAASTGLRPFSINRVSFTLAITIATLVIAKLVNAYLFCGFNLNFYWDMPFGAILSAGYCVMPLLGLAVNRRPRSKGGCCCRMFTIVLISIWLVGFTCSGTYIFFYYSGIFGGYDGDNTYFNVCGNRTNVNVRAQFSKAMPTFDIFQRIDLAYKVIAGIGWLFPMVFSGVAFGFFVASLEVKDEHPPLEDSEAGNPEDNDDETIIWMEDEEGKPEEFSAAMARLGLIGISCQQATIDSDCESALADAIREEKQSKMEGGVEGGLSENDGNDSSDADPQFYDVQPAFNCIDEDEADPTETATATKENVE